MMSPQAFGGFVYQCLLLYSGVTWEGQGPFQTNLEWAHGTWASVTNLCLLDILIFDPDSALTLSGDLSCAEKFNGETGSTSGSALL
jgi:hypothetical protein